MTGETPDGVETDKSKDNKEKTDPVKPLTEEDWGNTTKNYKTNINALKANFAKSDDAIDNTEQKVLDHFKSKKEEIVIKGYNTELAKIKEEKLTEPERMQKLQEIRKKYTPQIKALNERVRRHMPTEKEDKKDLLSKTANEKTLNDLKAGIKMPQGFSLDGEKGKFDEKNENQSNIPIMKNGKMVGTLDIKIDGTATVKRLEKQDHQAKDIAEVNTYLDKFGLIDAKDYKEMAKKIAKQQYNIEAKKDDEGSKGNFVAQEMITALMPELGITKGQLEQANKGKLELTEAQKRQVEGCLKVEIHEYSDKEGNKIETFLENLYSNAEGIKKDQLSEIENLFDEKSDSMREYLVKTCKIDLSGDTLTITDINGKAGGKKGEVYKIKTVENLNIFSKLLPGSMPVKFREILNAENSEQLENKVKIFQALGKEHLATLNQLEEIQAQLFDSNAPGKFGIMALFQLWQSIKAAFESNPPDITTIGEVFHDVTNGRNPAEIMKKNGENYAKILNNKKPPATLTQLLKSYLNPRGEEADKLFSKDNAKAAGIKETGDIGRYMKEAQPVIKIYLAKKLNTGLNDIKDIQQLENGAIEITAYNKKGNQIALELMIDGAKTKYRIVEYVQKLDNDKKPIEDELIKSPSSLKKDFKEIAGITKLAQALGSQPAKEKALADNKKLKGKNENKKNSIKIRIDNVDGTKGNAAKTGEKPASNEKAQQKAQINKKSLEERQKIDNSIKKLKTDDPKAWTRFVKEYKAKLKGADRKDWHKVTEFERDWLNTYVASADTGKDNNVKIAQAKASEKVDTLNNPFAKQYVESTGGVNMDANLAKAPDSYEYNQDIKKTDYSIGKNDIEDRIQSKFAKANKLTREQVKANYRLDVQDVDGEKVSITLNKIV